jgi:rare lipoprotein A (peptidoglycan hydrolase)
VFLLPAASRSGSLPPPSVVALTGTPQVEVKASCDLQPCPVEVTGGVPISALISGRATWYCGNGSPCTRGTSPDDMVAAIDPTTGIDKGERVTVRHGGRSVTVRIVDVCACGGSRVIDLTSGAFRRLAPLSRGVIAVELEFGGPAPTLPPTDTIVDNFLRWGIDKYTHR